MKFSIIIPVHNTELYLNRCLDSVLSQTYSDYEMILIDDGSTDMSSKVCDEYRYKYSDKVKVIHQKQSGLSEARNTGIRNAQGEYFLLLDSDDVILPDSLEKIAEKCKTSPDMVVFDYTIFYHDTELETGDIKVTSEIPVEVNEGENGESFLEIVLKESLEQSAFYQWCPWRYCYKMSFFVNNRFTYPKGRNFEDLSLTWRVLLAAQNVSVLRTCVYGYRKNVEGSITKTYNYKNINDRLFCTVENMQMVKENKELSQSLKAHLQDHFCEHYFIVLTMSDLPATREQRKKLMADLKQNVWIAECSLRTQEQFLAKLIKVCGLPLICTLLHIRRRIVYHGQFKRSKT